MNQYTETKIQEEIDSGVSSNGTHLHNNQQEDMISQKLEKIELQCNEVKEQEEQEQGKFPFYPLRPNVEDCSFYIKTGTCKFGPTCRFNHPVDRDFQDHEKRSEENNGAIFDSKKIDCKYYRTPGGCKYGDSCRYNHSGPKLEKEGPKLNFLGLPVRPLEQECTFYLRTGSCSYGANCRFHHPDPTAVNESNPQNQPTNMRGGNNYPKTFASKPYQSYGNSRGLPDLSNGISLMNGLPYAPINSYHQTIPYNTGWKQDQVNVPLSSKKTPLPYQTFNNSKKEDPSRHYEQQIQSEEFPVRPGQPDCDFFMKTGDCKYRVACRFNHPPSRAPKLYEPQLPSRSFHSKSNNYELPSNPISTRKNGKPSYKQPQMLNGSHPERPGQPDCEFFMKTGTCKFGAACKYHHPRDRMSTPLECALNQDGFPLRPGAKICRNYEQQGTCKYGQNCLFHHPDISPEIADQVNEDEDHRSSSNVGDAIDSQSTSNVKSNWGDDWVM